MSKINEFHIEELTIKELEQLGYSYLHGQYTAIDSDTSDRREKFSDVVLKNRLQSAISHINPSIPAHAQEQSVKEILRITTPDLLATNEKFHDLLINGVNVEYRNSAGEQRGDKVWLIDYENIENNEFIACNQFTVIENHQNKRPDIVIFINGIPLIVLELKNPGDENATIQKAYNQIQTYKSAIPSLFQYNAFVVISDGLEAKAGTISSDMARYMAWKTADGKQEASKLQSQLLTLIHGMLNKQTLIDLIKHFIVYEKHKKENPQTHITTIEAVKKLAAYHQYYAVRKAVDSTLQASSIGGSGKGGVVWHTQGSGKSLSMVFYTGKLVLAMDNPTIVVLTDRNDLDDQLFDTFAASTQLLRQEPVQADSRENLKQLLKVAAGGIIFTTLQKFSPDEEQEQFPLLSDRKNIVVIADEAHRSQYGFEAKTKYLKDEAGNETGTRIGYGFAKHMRDALPNATFIGFTGTPVESTDRNTKAVFGDYVDIYDISQAVEDGATVRIYYESRLAKVNIDAEAKQILDTEFEEITEGQELTSKQQARSKWARLEAIVGNENRLRNVAEDIVKHFEERQSVWDGKGMIVAMSRRIAVALYNEIVKLRPDWHDPANDKGAIKVIMTGSSSDEESMQPHIRNKEARRAIGDRLKDPKDPLKLVIVRDMWLTGFDAPCLHTLYVDKPMKGHNLMQAIARVNRVYKDKPGGLIVDYIGVASDLKKALATYTESGGQGEPTLDIAQAVDLMITKLEVVRQMMFGFDYRPYFTASTSDKLSIILGTEDHILGLQNGKDRYLKEVISLSKAFALAKSQPEALEINDEVAFFQTVKARLVKFDTTGRGNGTGVDMETAIKQLIDKTIVSDKVIDIFDAAGIKKPDISILSNDFMEEIKGMRHRNLAIELLKKLLNDEIKIRSRFNAVQSKKFSEMLETAVRKYQNNLLTATEIITEIIGVAKEFKEAISRGEKLNLSEDELAFYDALEANDNAVQVLGDNALKDIAKILVEKVRANTTIDWTVKESVRANLRVIIKRVLRQYGYPPDIPETKEYTISVERVLNQAEQLAANWN